MLLAIQEAQKGGLAVRPNPQVGCAIELANGEVILGHHARYGAPHAECDALSHAERSGAELENARIAITLEPCVHVSPRKSVPCVELLLKHKWNEILIGGEDSYAEVRGRGIEKLREKAFTVKVGVLAEQCRALNRKWLSAHERGRAFLTLKLATSIDGKWTSDSGASQWITSEAARAHAHLQRETFDAIITSGETVRRDDPRFTARDGDGQLLGRQPAVHVLTTRPDFNLEGRALEKHPRGAQIHRPDRHLEGFLVERLKEGHFDCLLEAGPGLSSVFLKNGLVDEVHCYLETQFLGGRKAKSFSEAFNGGGLPGLGFQIREMEKVGNSSLFLVLERSNALRP